MKTRLKRLSRAKAVVSVALVLSLSACATENASPSREVAPSSVNDTVLALPNDEPTHGDIVIELCDLNTYDDMGPLDEYGLVKRVRCSLDPTIFPDNARENINGRTVSILEVEHGSQYDETLANDGNLFEYSFEAPLGENYLQVLSSDSLDWLIISQRVLALYPESSISSDAMVDYIAMSDEDLTVNRCVADFVWAFEMKRKYEDYWDSIIEENWTYNESDLDLLEDLISDFQLERLDSGEDASYTETSYRVHGYCSQRGGYPSENFTGYDADVEDDELPSEATEPGSRAGSQSPLDGDDWSMSDLRASADPSEVAGPECEELMAETLRLWALGDGDRDALLEPFTPEGQVIMGDLLDYVTVAGLSPIEAKQAMGNVLYPNICK